MPTPQRTLPAALGALGLLAAISPAAAQEPSAAPAWDGVTMVDAVGAASWQSDPHERVVAVLDDLGLDAAAFLACSEPEEPGLLDRMVTNVVVVRVHVDADRTVRFEAPEAPADVNACVSALGNDDGAPRALSANVELGDFSQGEVRFYDHNYPGRRVERAGGVVALYALAGTSAALGIGSFVGARRDDEYTESLDLDRTSPSDANLAGRADRLRKAGWSMVGLSLGSFVAGTLMHQRHRAIERRENPTLVWDLGAPGAGVGLTLTTRF